MLGISVEYTTQTKLQKLTSFMEQKVCTGHYQVF